MKETPIQPERERERRERERGKNFIECGMAQKLVSSVNTGNWLVYDYDIREKETQHIRPHVKLETTTVFFSTFFKTRQLYTYQN